MSPRRSLSVPSTARADPGAPPIRNTTVQSTAAKVPTIPSRAATPRLVSMGGYATAPRCASQCPAAQLDPRETPILPGVDTTPATPICPSCGAAPGPEARFCLRCGTAVDGVAWPEAVADTQLDLLRRATQG